jgi:hypothetical protein
MKRFLSFLSILALLPGVLSAQVGPGLGNLTYNASELYNSIWKYTELNHMGSTMATMHNGYLITTFHPDSGKPPGGILVWDVSNPRSPKLVKRIYDTRTQNFRENHALPQHGNYMLFQDGCGFQIWDFSNPLEPKQVKRHCMSGYSHDDYGATWQMFWQAPYIFIANGSKGFDVVDASDINNPQLVKHITSPRQVGPIFAVGNLLVTSAHDFGRGFTLYDISDPRNPQLINSYSNTENMYASSLNGNQLVISARGNANNAIFSTYDISDPINITKTATLNIGNSGEQLYNATQDNFIFQGCQSEIVKIDQSNPKALKIAGRGSLNIRGDSDHGQVTPLGNLLFVGNDHGSGSGFVVHQTAPDTKAPEVNMVIPRSNSVNQASTSRIGVTLTDNIMLESINQSNFIVRPVGGNAVSGKYSYQFATINFSPDQPLLVNTTYEIVIPAGGIKDIVGNPINKAFTSYFSTGPNGNFPPSIGSTPWEFEENNKVTLFWNNIPNSSSYIVKKSDSPSGPFKTIATTNKLSYTDLQVENDRYYYYTISGENNYGEGIPSSVIRAMPSLYITDLNWTSSTNGWGPVEIDQSNGEESSDDGRIITLNTQAYSRGLGVHAASSVSYNLNGAYLRFQSDIGIDDEVGTNGSVVFTVLLDGKEIYNSGLMTGESATKKIDVSVLGGKILTLKVDPDGNNGMDHASWGGPRLRLPAQPYSGTPHTVPGRIEAEEYDKGGEGIAYHEANTNGNEGGADFRMDEVDIEKTSDVGGGYNIGYALNGEWLKYSLNAKNDGVYTMTARVAAEGEGKIFHVEIDGEDISGPVNIPNTGGWQSWNTISIGEIFLSQGNHEMRIVFDADYMNLNYIDIVDVITGLNIENTSGVRVFPNPFSSNGIQLQLEGLFEYTILNTSGQKLESGKGDSKLTIGHELSEGIYLLNVKTEDHVFDIKIIKK